MRSRSPSGKVVESQELRVESQTVALAVRRSTLDTPVSGSRPLILDSRLLPEVALALRLAVLDEAFWLSTLDP
jgi:hypothetical protein